MPSVTPNTHFDGRSILLDEPYQIPPEARLLVTLVGPGQDEEVTYVSLHGTDHPPETTFPAS